MTTQPDALRSLLIRCREFIDATQAPAYPAGVSLADEIDAMLTQGAPQATQGEQEPVADSFREWFSKNYPADTIILDPDWHARSIYRMAMAHARLTAPVATQGEQLDAKDKECLDIGRAINRAAGDLPADGEIRIEIENGAGAVYVNEPKHGDWRYIDSSDVFSAQINAAIDAALSATTPPVAKEG